MTSKKVPFVLAVEGASGPIDSSVMALFPDPKIKQAALDYLMREGMLTGMEYFRRCVSLCERSAGQRLEKHPNRAIVGGNGRGR